MTRSRWDSVADLNKPEANLTGVSGITDFLLAKQVGLLRELYPRAKSFALLVNPASQNAKRLVQITQMAAKAIGRELIAVAASDEDELASVFATLAERHPGGVVIANECVLSGRAPADRRTRCEIQDCRGLRRSRICGSRWFDQLRTKRGQITAGGRLRRENPARCQTRGLACREAVEV